MYLIVLIMVQKQTISKDRHICYDMEEIYSTYSASAWYVL